MVYRGCPLYVHYWADLQSVHGFRCYDNIATNVKCQWVLACTHCTSGWLINLVVVHSIAFRVVSIYWQGDDPFPLKSCLQVAKRVKTRSLQEWVYRSLWAKISGGRGRRRGIFFGFYKTRHILLSNGANFTVLRAVVLTQYRRVTDRQTDQQTDRRTDGRTDGRNCCS